MESEQVDELDSDDGLEGMAVDASVVCNVHAHAIDNTPVLTGSTPQLATKSLLGRFHALKTMHAGSDSVMAMPGPS